MAVRPAVDPAGVSPCVRVQPDGVPHRGILSGVRYGGRWSGVVRRRRAVGLCLLAGLVLNVLVAWTCEVTPVPVPLNRRPILDPKWPTGVPDTMGLAPGSAFGWSDFGRRCSAYSTSLYADGQYLGYAGVEVCEVGWPLRSLARHRWFNNVGGPLDLPGGSLHRERWALALPAALTPRGMARGSGRLSLRPLWPGFVVNTLVFATAMWAPTGGLAGLRRGHRRRRGRCAHCAYDLRDSPNAACPECGRPATLT